MKWHWISKSAWGHHYLAMRKPKEPPIVSYIFCPISSLASDQWKWSYWGTGFTALLWWFVIIAGNQRVSFWLCCGEGETIGMYTTICNLHFTSWVCCTPTPDTTTPLHVTVNYASIQLLSPARSGDVALMPVKIRWTSRTSMSLLWCFFLRGALFKSWSSWKNLVDLVSLKKRHFKLRPPNCPEDCWNVWE